MPSRRSWALTAALLLAVFAGTVVQADIRPHAGMLRYPDVSRSQIVFVYADRLWLVPRTGGLAQPLASPLGQPAFPRFSQDGQTIAFVANYDGNDDLYTLPVAGGVPMRVTHHPAAETLCDWTPDGKLLFFARGYFDLQRQSHLLMVPATGGLPEKLPVPYGAVGAISPDGTWLAYIPHTTDNRTWKRYLGGMATDIWLFNLRDYSAKRITDWPGTDSQPMWHGNTIYYMSDEGAEHRLNIWAYDVASGKRSQVTHLREFDIKWPALGPGADGGGEIVFQYGPDLYLLDLASGQAHAVEVMVPGDRPALRPQRVEVSGRIESWDVSPTGKRATFEARGDIWTVPAHKGSPRNLTRSSGVAERDPAWSPDGRWIAYLSDETGEYELYLVQSDGKGTARQLTGVPPATSQPAAQSADANSPAPPHIFRYSPTWSPDSKNIAFTDKGAGLWLAAVETGACRLIDRDPWGSVPQMSWSSDSQWLAYTRRQDNQQSALWVYHVPDGERQRLTSGMFHDTDPTFDRAGKYLYFVTNRHFRNPMYEDIGSSFIYANTGVLAVVPLSADERAPIRPTSDEEPFKKQTATTKPSAPPPPPQSEPVAETEELADAEEEAEHHEPAEADDGHHPAQTKPEVKPVELAVDGFERRAIPLPVRPGSFHSLAVSAEGLLLYVRSPRPGTDDSPDIESFDLAKAMGDGAAPQTEEEDEEESMRRTGAAGRALASAGARRARLDAEEAEKTVVEGAGSFVMSGDGKKLLVHKDGTYAVVEAKPDQKLDKPMSLDGMSAVIEPRAEWRQMYVESWRILRDFFYDPHMHGVDWLAQRDQYAKMLDDCVSRSDLSLVICELISELNVGHAYYFGDDWPNQPRVSVGLLAADFELADVPGERWPDGSPAAGRRLYRLRVVHDGGPWDLDGRNPLTMPGIDIRAGDYLLAVNEIPIDTAADPWAALQGMAGRVATLTVWRPVPDSTSAPASVPAPARTSEPASAPTTRPDSGKPRDVVIELLTVEEDAAVRYRAWVQRNREYVERASDGRVGYIHVPDTGSNGQNELFRQFYGQRDLPALIIDERWNAGGQIPNRFIELLNRPLLNYWATREGKPSRTPYDAHQGPKCMLINGLAGSGGDAFPYYFREARLGKLIGTRTWGGLVGLSGNPRLIDGAVVTAPTFAFYETDGTWGVEGHGVAPDLEVLDDPALMVRGGDPQLDRGVQEMLAEIKQKPFVPAPVPPYPDRSGMGLPDKDR